MTTSYHTSKQNTTPISIPYSIKVHSQLAQVIISGKEFTRAFALWLMLRSSDNSGHVDKQSVIDLALLHTGKAQSTVYSWLSQGEGIFWNSSNDRLWLIGKEKVFDHFLGEGVRPGKVILVPSELILTSRLHIVRSNLSATWVTNDHGKIMSRIGRKNILQAGIPERTQQSYDQTSGVKVKPIIVRSEQQKKQLPNLYIRPDSFYTLNTDKRLKRQFFGFRGTDFNVAESAKVNNNLDSFSRVEKHGIPNESQNKFGGNRTYFSDKDKAVEVAEYRRNQNIRLPVYLLHNQNSNDPQIISSWLH